MTDQPEKAGGLTALLTFTESAKQKILPTLDSQGKQERTIRLAIQGRQDGRFRYTFTIVEEGQESPDDAVIDCGTFKVLVDPQSAPNLKDATVDFVDDPTRGSGFEIQNPNPVWTDPQAMRIQELIDTQINPGVGSHGGHVELLDVKDNMVYIALGGGCQGCGMVDVTLKQGIEKIIKEAVPEIVGVVDTTDHEAGTNPYYQAEKK